MALTAVSTADTDSAIDFSQSLIHCFVQVFEINLPAKIKLFQFSEGVADNLRIRAAAVCGNLGELAIIFACETLVLSIRKFFGSLWFTLGNL
jgi:hypothetical protein